MFYVFSYTPTEDDVADTPHVIEMDLTKGIIHQVDVLFQSGCGHAEFVQIFDADLQVWPINRGEKFRGDATIVSFRDFYELDRGNDKLTARIWSTLESDWKEIIIQVGILPREILQPLSFDALVRSIQQIGP